LVTSQKTLNNAKRRLKKVERETKRKNTQLNKQIMKLKKLQLKNEERLRKTITKIDNLHINKKTITLKQFQAFQKTGKKPKGWGWKNG